MSAERARRGEAPAAGSPALQAGGGGSTSDGMDARVARLEAHVEILRSESSATRADIGDMRVSLATLTERAGSVAEGMATLTTRAGTSDERMTTLTGQLAASTEQLAILTERMAHLPTKGFVISTNMTALAFLSALMLFGETLRALAGL